MSTESRESRPRVRPACDIFRDQMNEGKDGDSGQLLALLQGLFHEDKIRQVLSRRLIQG